MHDVAFFLLFLTLINSGSGNAPGLMARNSDTRPAPEAGAPPAVIPQTLNNRQKGLRRDTVKARSRKDMT